MNRAQLTIGKFSIGQEVVVGHLWSDDTFNPCVCNSVASPKHPCRTTVVKLGRKLLTVVMTGYKNPTAQVPASGETFVALPLDVAKAAYERALRKGGRKSETDIRRLVDSL